MITILGTTASGKTHLAVQLAYEIGGEIISADSRQVYKGMDIGSGKDIEEYTINNKSIPYYLIDIKEAGYEYSVFEFQQDFLSAYNTIQKNSKMPILCGGTGMYLESVLQQYKFVDVPVNDELRFQLSNKTNAELQVILQQISLLHNTTDILDRERLLRAIEIRTFQKQNTVSMQWPKMDNVVFGILHDRLVIRNRITERLSQRLQNGMIGEVRQLLTKVPAERLIKYGLEYKYVTLYLKNEITYEEMFRLLNIAIHQFAKRQMTWYRRMEKKGIKINWIDGNLSTREKILYITNYISK